MFRGKDWSRQPEHFTGRSPALIGLSFRNVDDCFWPSARSFVGELECLLAKVRGWTDAPVVLGGVGFSIFAEAILRRTGAEFGIVGDGEVGIPALLSAVVDNVPITIAMIPVIEGLGASGMNIQPLWWAVVFGAGLGGNGTIIGSTANIVVASLSEKTRTPITSALWNRRGLPVMLATCVAASLLYAIFYNWMSQ